MLCYVVRTIDVFFSRRFDEGGDSSAISRWLLLRQVEEDAVMGILMKYGTSTVVDCRYICLVEKAQMWLP